MCLFDLNSKKLFGLLLVLGLFSSVQAATDCRAVTEISTIECQSLLQLYHSTDGANWKNNDGWNVTNTPCRWNGVTCENGGVTEISLRNNQLTGPIPDFSGLPKLENFYFHGNQLTGFIPDFSGLPLLERIELDNNQLTGPIPDFSKLPNLRYLLLYNNQLTGSIPDFSGLPILTMLPLEFNQLTGPIPDFSGLPLLEWFSLHNNQLTGPIPDFSGLPLEYLDLRNNLLCKRTDIDYSAWSIKPALWRDETSWQEQLNEFPDCSPSTQSQAATDCNAVTEISTIECQSLLELYNSTDGPNWGDNDGWNETNTPCSWYGVTCENGGVIWLGLSDNKLTGTMPDFIGLPNLIGLDFSDNQLTETISNVSKLPNLAHLDLSNNQLSGHIPDFDGLHNLALLFLNENKLTGPIPDLSRLSNLAWLKLNNNLLCKRTDIDYANWPIEQTLWDDIPYRDISWQEELNQFPNCSSSNQSSSEFCTGGSININSLSENCSNGNCSSTGIKITCNNEICQWCDAIDNCGNILYNGVTSITSGSINCTNGQCSYNLQNGGSNSSGNFSCQTNITTQVATVNSQAVYKIGETIRVTLPQLPSGQTQYVGISLPNNGPFFLLTDLNSFIPFDGVNLPAWQGGEVAIEIPVTTDIPFGEYTVYLLRMKEGINPMTVNVSKWEVGVTTFIISDNDSLTSENSQIPLSDISIIHVTETSTNLGILTTDGKNETLAIFGKKDSQGRLTKITKVVMTSNSDPSQAIQITIGDNSLPTSIDFPDGSTLEMEEYYDTGASTRYTHPDGSVSHQDIPLPMDDISGARDAINDYIQHQQNSPIPTNDILCQQAMEKFLRLTDNLVWGVSQMMSIVACVTASMAAVLPGTAVMAIPMAMWACGSVVLNGLDKIMDATTGGNSPVEDAREWNSGIGTIADCLKRDLLECASGVADMVYDFERKSGKLTPEKFCPKTEPYLYADCGGKTYQEDGTPICTIPYGGQIEITIFYHKPQPYPAIIGFAESGGPGVIPPEFEAEIPANSTTGTIRYTAKHQVLWNSERPNCYSTAGDPNNVSAPDPGAIWGLAMEIPEAPNEGGFVITKGITVLSQRHPLELSIVTEGNGKGSIAGVEIGCWYHMERIQ
jgi:Leucine-rich repeat (LRR) protein